MAKRGGLKLTAFVREVVLPAGPDRVPKLDRRHMRFALRHKKSKIHRWGIFADEEIPAKRRVIEYTGERIDGHEVVRRSVRPHVYHFWLSGRWAVDGAIGGSGAEFINHSCDPNLVARISKGHIWLVSVRRIAKGEELSFDYRLSGAQMLPCKCGVKGCRGYLNPIIMDE
ncbi:MAG TPA: SET domain-containing protein-lysine N-methyltransferase [Bryobacteraceae bacterium]|nr:SET domain-containing protein-lysine N-methyltransferase [Bryobacteraceae bacterium]